MSRGCIKRYVCPGDDGVEMYWCGNDETLFISYKGGWAAILKPVERFEFHDKSGEEIHHQFRNVWGFYDWPSGIQSLINDRKDSKDGI